MTAGFEHLQLAAFFAGFPTSSSAASLWQKFFSEPYSAFNTLGPGHTQATGVEDGVAFEVQLQQNRIDLIVRPVSPPNQPPSVAADLRDLYRPGLAKLLAMVADLTVTRIATVTNYAYPVSSGDAAIDRLTERVPGIPLEYGLADVSFQISKPIDSNVQHGLHINRLCRWNTATTYKMLVQVGPLGPTHVPSEAQLSVDEFIDVNTVPSVRVEPELIPQIFDEMLTEIDAIVEIGAARILRIVS